MRAGDLQVELTAAGLGAVRVDGVEVLRGLTFPVRNADWGTYQVQELHADSSEATHERRFAEVDGLFTGRFRVWLTLSTLRAEVEIAVQRDAIINRAGFTLLHPIRGVAGTPLTILHPDGSQTQSAFPALISPVQPARDIAGLRHQVQGWQVDIGLEGDVFEMEDQRNWSDASFKTYCRPLSLPYPYAVRQGQVLRQSLMLSLSKGPPQKIAKAAAAGQKRQMPQVLLAQESGLSSLGAMQGFDGVPLLARVSHATPAADLATLAQSPALALEIAFDDLADLQRQVDRTAGLRPARVVALPVAFLKSYQPDAIWPSGAQPADALPVLRKGFPKAQIGGGSLTNFTELNRCRPDAEAVDFITFGNTAIVHAADDLSVWQTLEALPDILASAHSIARGKPLHLGLVSIGMRSNPYGDKVAANPRGLRLPMAMADPRQDEGFAAAYAVAVLARAAEAGVASLALAMPDGPLGARGALAQVIRQAAGLAGRPVALRDEAGLVVIHAGGAGLAANLGDGAVAVPECGGQVLHPAQAAVWGQPA